MPARTAQRQSDERHPAPPKLGAHGAMHYTVDRPASALSCVQRGGQMPIGISWIEVLGYLGAFLTLGTYSMKRMIPLRIIGICANCVFIVYGFLAPVYPQLLLHAVLLPLNAFRLREMLQLIAKVRTASQGDLNMEWLKPFMTKRSVKQGQV